MYRTPIISIGLALATLLGAQFSIAAAERPDPERVRQREILRTFQAVAERPMIHRLRYDFGEVTPEMLEEWRKSSYSADGKDFNFLEDVILARTAKNVPPEVLKRVQEFFEHVRMNRWPEAAGYVSKLSEALPFNRELSGAGIDYPRLHRVRGIEAGDRAKLSRITESPEDLFGWPRDGKGVWEDGAYVEGWTVTIPRYREESGWLVSYLEYGPESWDTHSIYWVREEGEWKVLCDLGYISYLDCLPGSEIDPALSRNVTECETATCKGLSRSLPRWRGRRYFKKAWSFHSEKYKKENPFKDFDGGEWSPLLGLISVKFVRVAGYRIEADGIRVFTESYFKLFIHQGLECRSSLWFKEGGRWCLAP